MGPELIVALNGPPHVGKDTLGDRIALMRDDVGLFKFAQPLHEAAEAFGHGDKEAVGWSGMTGRQFRIWLSEEVFKPRFGSDVFGSILAGRLTSAAPTSRVAVITDCGFFDELDKVAAQLPLKRIILVRLIRDKLTFAGDSRDYVRDHPVAWWETVDLHLQTGQEAADARRLNGIIEEGL